MRTYDRYKETPHPTLKSLPEHWRLEPLKRLATIRLSGVDKHTTEGETPVSLCNYTDVYKNDVIRADMPFMSATATPDEIAALSLRAGDVLITKDSEEWQDIAVPAYVPEDMPGVICGYHLALVRPKRGVRGGYLARAFVAASVAHQFKIAANGVTRFGLGYDDIKTARFPVPPTDEQDAILGYLERKLDEINRFVAVKQKFICLLREQRTAVIDQAVLRGINARARTKESGLPWLGATPAHWQVRKNGSLFRERNDRGNDVLPILVVSLRTGVTVGMDDDERRPRKLIEDRAKYKRARKGDIAYNMMRMWQGAVGVAPVEGLVSPAYVVATPRDDVSTDYYAHLFRTGAYKAEVNRVSTGIVSDRNRLYWDDFKQLPSPYPPVEEQCQIVEHINRLSAEIEAAELRARREIELINEYRAALISDAVTGKIDVRSNIAATATPAVVTARVPARKSRKANKHFCRSVLAAEIVDQHQGIEKFGWIKLQKSIILAERHLRLPEIQSEPQRAAAGPFDNKMMRSVHGMLERAKWFKPVKRQDHGYQYVPMQSHGGHRRYFDRYWGDRRQRFDDLMAIIKPMTTEQAEIVATLYMAWNDFLLRGEQVDDDRLVQEVRSNWHDAKKRITEDRWRRAVAWMRQKGLTPSGFGTATANGTEADEPTT
jgi:type I restriction enzyme S subunit